MKFELKLNKEQITEIGKGAGKIGKAIIVEGTKAVALKGAHAVITQSFDGGFRTVSDLDLDDILRGGKKKEPKKGLFSFKRKVKEDGDIVETEVDIEFVDVEEDAVIMPDENPDVIIEKKPTTARTRKAN